MPADTLTPNQAAKRFGELRHASTLTYMEFEDARGIWRPELYEGELVRYKLYPPDRLSGTRWRRR